MIGRRRFLTALGAALGSASLAGCHAESSGAPSESTDQPIDHLRPRFHYSAATGNLADPNGLVYAAGTFHLFHQSDGRWAHASAPDLVRWTRLGTALEHDELGQALSGSAVVEGDRLVAAYTCTTGGEAQCLAFASLDGVRWSRYERNPVIANGGRRDFRDPKVIWHAPTGRWVMLVAAGDAIDIFTSDDLVSWQPVSRFGPEYGLHSAVWECPGLVELPVPGTAERRWVLFTSVGDSAETDGSTMQYFVGDFDGTSFHPAEGPDVVRVIDHGQDFYAAQTWFGAPGDRAVWIAWLGNWRYPYQLPTGAWRGVMSVPRELSLVSRPDGSLFLAQQPVAELQSLRVRTTSVRPGPVSGQVPVGSLGTSLDIELDLEPGSGRCGLQVLGVGEHVTEIGVDREAGVLYLDRSRSGTTMITDRAGAPYELPFRAVSLDDVTRRTRLRVLVDQSTVEVFDERGPVMSCVVLPPPGADGVAVFATGSETLVHELTVHQMSTIW